ncbi:putative type IV pilus assembly PilZ [Megalodesulfovibrio gigas DSM 1382 = ATCC 19364]|uniref:Putative type IV pilus assembly PilZ n=2 Tax=Megalodesulfovibrio gigas TaxID=879 RepID=T2GF86_MEGG1|nr:putative type IV pilus assembly PilZ [Megalodesulfovibrio gigas DSM 1382 = ATCC 19364]
MHTFFADPQGMVTIVCPHCSRERRIDAARYKQGKKPLLVTCSCGHRFESHLELRQAPRKRVQLAGEYTHLETQERDELLIQNLSLTGMRFSIPDPHDVRMGDRLRVSFVLETPLRPTITRELEITGISRQVIHGRFTNAPARDADLGFYLMSQPQD